MVADRYEIGELLSYGAMGVVYRVRHRTLGIEMALKVMRSELATGEFCERFAEEARNAALLESEHVVRVFDFGRLDSGELYLAMELLRGEDLATVLGRGPLPVELVLRLAIQACEALGEAHRAGIVHRDLKPENLFLVHSPSGDASLKVLDFGVSKRMRSARRNASLAGAMGSPSYMSPEQLRCARDVDSRADIWALGAVLFELFTGRAAFEGETIAEICTSVLHKKPPPVVDLRPEVGTALSRIVERCLESDRERRFQTMTELSIALRSLRRRSEKTGHDEELPPIAGLRRWRARHALGGIAALGVIAGATLVGYFGPTRSLELARTGATSYLVGGAQLQRAAQHSVERPLRALLPVATAAPTPTPTPTRAPLAPPPQVMKRAPITKPPPATELAAAAAHRPLGP